MKTAYLFLLSFFILFGCQNNNVNEADEEAQDQVKTESGWHDAMEVSARLPEVQVGPLTAISVSQTITCTGRIDIPPIDIYSMHSKTPGFVEMKKYISGDYVRKGTLLLTVQNPQLVEKQRLLLETKASLSLAEKDFERKMLLHAEKATTQRAFDEALARKDLLTARYKGMRSELELLGIDLDALEKEYDFQSRHAVFSTTSGHIHEIYVVNGQQVDPGTRLMDISDNDHIHLELKVLSKDVHLLEIGQQVTFMLPNDMHTYAGEIIKLSPMIDKETGTLNVHCHIEKEHVKDVRAGMFVNAEINVGVIDVKGLPVEATVREGGDYFGFFSRNGKLVKTKLENPRKIDGFITFDNIPDGDVVLSGAYYLL